MRQLEADERGNGRRAGGAKVRSQNSEVKTLGANAADQVGFGFGILTSAFSLLHSHF
jgi:hypothetical protein